MRRRTFLQSLAGSAAGALAPVTLPRALYAIGTSPPRSLLIAVAPNAHPAVAEAANTIATAYGHPLLNALTPTSAPRRVDSLHLLNGHANDLAFNHLVLVGALDDPLIVAAWQREARRDPESLYIFGFGHLRGDIGYLESDRNPFLHSQAVPTAPFETQVITLTGTTPAGIKLAVQAFLQHSLVNGVVAAPGWSRPSPSLLERDPLPASFTPPAMAPQRIGKASRIAWTQASEDEYRGVLADTGVSPRVIWRAKYFSAGNWDSPGAAGSFDNYAAGLHRRSYGNTLWLAQFSDPPQAAAAAPKIAAAADLHPDRSGWHGEQNAYANGTYVGEQRSPGTLTLSQSGDAPEWLILSAMQNRIA